MSITSIYLAAIILGVFLICVLLTQAKKHRNANKILALLIGLLVISMWNIFVWISGLDTKWKLFDYNIWSSPYLWGPILYFYVRTISGDPVKTRREIINHCSLSFGLFVAQWPLYIVTTNEWVGKAALDMFGSATLLTLYVQLALYLLACAQTLKRYSLEIKQQYSAIETINLLWLKRLTLVFTGLLAVDMLTTVPAVLRQEPMPYLPVLVLAEAIAIFLIGFFSLSAPEVLLNTHAHAVEKPKYESSPLNYNLSINLAEKLNAIMLESKIYQRNDLRLATLADAVGVSPHHLSQLINEHFGKSFYDFVNEFRVHAATQALSATRKSNITNIAFEAGFNNRTSFNNSFKKITGLTPSQYRHRNQVES